MKLPKLTTEQKNEGANGHWNITHRTKIIAGLLTALQYSKCALYQHKRYKKTGSHIAKENAELFSKISYEKITQAREYRKSQVKINAIKELIT